MSETDQRSPFRTYAAAPPRKSATNSGSKSIVLQEFISNVGSKENNDPSQVAASDDPSSSQMSITHGLSSFVWKWRLVIGVVLNGQCLCACPGAVPPVLFGSSPSRQFSIDSSASIPIVTGIPASVQSQPTVVDMQTAQQQKLQQQWEREQRQLQEQFQRKQNQLYQQQVYQQQPTSQGMSGLITGPSRSIESGIGDGFERFFQVVSCWWNGQ